MGYGRIRNPFSLIENRFHPASRKRSLMLLIWILSPVYYLYTISMKLVEGL